MFEGYKISSAAGNDSISTKVNLVKTMIPYRKGTGNVC